jgi:hypothetical protein
VREYAFERAARIREPGHLRDRDLAIAEVDAFLERVSSGADFQALNQLDPELGELLLKHGQEVHLNLAWYEAHVAAGEKRRQEGVVAATAFGLFALAVLVVLPLVFGGGGRDGLWAAELGFLASGLVGVTQFIGQISDTRAEGSLFREASANLQEALYDFEHAWRARPRPLAGEAASREELKGALWEQVRLARAVVRKEREEHFKLLKSPADVAAGALTALDAVRGRRPDLASAARVLADERARTLDARAEESLDQALLDAREAVRKATAELAAAGARRLTLRRLSLEPDAVAAERSEQQAQVQLAEAEARLKALRSARASGLHA